MNKFQIILADPPWSYNDKMIGFGGAEGIYNTQNKDYINRLPINDISDNNSVLFLWVVSPLLIEGIETLKSWGFKYKTIAFVWSKNTKNGKKVSNLGRWTMGNVELCLLGVKGKPKRICKNVKQLVEAERTTHSKKPDIVKDRIVELMGDLPRIELFARQSTPGWTCLGNEIDGKDINVALKELIGGNND